MADSERKRLEEHARREKHWRRWGPYLAERQWGTVREDYSRKGEPWDYLTHDMAPAYAYRWGEDGIAGISDNHQRLCLSIALWNGKDPLLKERLFGLDNNEGNHGEDVKEYYWYLDNTPSHSYMRYLYRYPQAPFPYERLREENLRRGRREGEFELAETGVFDESRYFDVAVEYAKADDEDICMRITIRNAGPDSAELHVLPMAWFRNDWKWWKNTAKPILRRTEASRVELRHPSLGRRSLEVDCTAQMLFTENETNTVRLYGSDSDARYFKDGFQRRIIDGDEGAVKEEEGTRAAFWRVLKLPAGAEERIYLRLHNGEEARSTAPDAVDAVVEERSREAEAFYEGVLGDIAGEDDRRIARQALSGMLWTKQWYHYVIEQWLDGDPAMPAPERDPEFVRNEDWKHLYSDDILSMPDKWEFPWFATWDLAFHAIPLAVVDPDFAKRQLDRLTREWYMHPNGQLPAYEWDFGDVNPPVHAWAAYKVFDMERQNGGEGDARFLEAVYHKLLMNFTWWVNRKDEDGDNVFQGGFMGMDNIGVFDWSQPLPLEGQIEQSDTTSWMAAYCLHMLRIAWELAPQNRAYEDIASKFFEHFLYIARAVYDIGESGASLWCDDDGFFYDQLRRGDGAFEPLRIRSMVGLIPLLAVELLDYERIDALPGFKRRMDWFFSNRGDLAKNITCSFEPGSNGRCILSIINERQLRSVLSYMLDEAEFLSPYGIRSLSKHHEERPFVFEREHYRSEVHYLPAESDTKLFGGNSNWRGPVWFPVNYLLIDALRRHHSFYGDQFRVECPTGSGHHMTLAEVADEITTRLLSIFRDGEDGRPVFGDAALFQRNPEWHDLIPFHEYFHGETGMGLGASHQTGWTGLAAKLLLEDARGG
jgi:glycogen debranching enzyme